jgi:hypothetical protein
MKTHLLKVKTWLFLDVKKSIFLIFFFLYAFISNSQPGYISIVSNGKDDFWVYVNGIRVSPNPGFYAFNIPVNTPVCHVRIVFVQPRIPAIEKVVSLKDPAGRWYHVTFFLRKVKRWLYVIDDADATYELLMPGLVYPPSGQPLMELQGHDDLGNPRIHPSTPSSPSAPPAGYCTPMDPGTFEAAKITISKASFDDSKLTIAKQIASSNCLLASQIRDIMRLFAFESTRLEFAKFAYPFCYDKGNYFLVNDAFTFSSSIDELNKFIYGY